MINKDNENSLKHEKLLELFFCNPDEGILIRKITTSNRSKAGSIAGSLTDSGYLVVRIDGKVFRVHRLVWFYFFKEFPDGILDHINGIRTDNRLDNLREANESLNLYNSKLRNDNTTGYKGVHYYKANGKYTAQIQINGKTKHLGYFDTAELAYEAYKSKAKEIHREFFKENP